MLRRKGKKGQEKGNNEEKDKKRRKAMKSPKSSKKAKDLRKQMEGLVTNTTPTGITREPNCYHPSGLKRINYSSGS